MTPFENEIRLFVYRHFSNALRAPTIDETGRALGVDIGRIRDAFESLAEQHVLVLQPDSRQVWMAMPFSAVPTPHRVQVGSSAWWGNCAWDALSIAALTHSDARITTRCPVSGETLQVDVRNGAVASDVISLVNFGVRAARWWDDVGYT